MKFLTLAVLVFLTGCTKKSDFPNILKFEKYGNCESPGVDPKDLVVSFFVLDKDEYASHNEVVTIIATNNGKKLFATRAIFNNLIQNEGAFSEIHKIYTRSSDGIWQEVLDTNIFLIEVTKNIPKKYQWDYRRAIYPEPKDDLEAFRNIIMNAGCSTHGPIGVLPDSFFRSQ